MLSADEARDVLGRMTAAETNPELSRAELLQLLDLTASRTDGVVTAWNYARAAAEGWRWKAGKASACFDIATGDQKLSRHQVYAACVDMAARYARLDSGSMVVLTPGTDPAVESEVVPL